METGLSHSIETHFQSLPDPRKQTMNMRHRFLDIIVIAVCGVICGANDWVSVAAFGNAKENWLQKFSTCAVAKKSQF